jgi:outer membrane immunogenic protein
MRINQIGLCGFVAVLGVMTASAALAAEPFESQHIGITIGGLSTQGSDARTTGTPAFLALGPTVIPKDLSMEEQAIVASLAYGFDTRLSDHWVVGAEMDVSYSNLDQKKTFSGAPIAGLAPAGLKTSASQKLDYMGTVRGRIGFMPTDNTLFYLTGGLAAGHFEAKADVAVNGSPALAWSGKDVGAKVGWTVGAGVEYSVTENISLKGEALYYNLGDISVTAKGNPAVRGVAALNGVDYAYKTDLKGIIARIGLNYRF